MRIATWPFTTLSWLLNSWIIPSLSHVLLLAQVFLLGPAIVVSEGDDVDVSFAMTRSKDNHRLMEVELDGRIKQPTGDLLQPFRKLFYVEWDNESNPLAICRYVLWALPFIREGCWCLILFWSTMNSAIPKIFVCLWFSRAWVLGSRNLLCFGAQVLRFWVDKLSLEGFAVFLTLNILSHTVVTL